MPQQPRLAPAVVVAVDVVVAAVAARVAELALVPAEEPAAEPRQVPVLHLALERPQVELLLQLLPLEARVVAVDVVVAAVAARVVELALVPAVELLPELEQAPQLALERPQVELLLQLEARVAAVDVAVAAVEPVAAAVERRPTSGRSTLKAMEKTPRELLFTT